MIPLAESFVAITPPGEIYTWGWNEHGNLGLGDTKDRSEPTLVKAPTIADKKKVCGAGAYWMIYS